MVQSLLNDAGFFPPTSGTAFVNGFDIRHDIEKVRTSLGLCPQHNVLFDDLTAEEHLIFFTKVTSLPRIVVYRHGRCRYYRQFTAWCWLRD